LNTKRVNNIKATHKNNQPKTIELTTQSHGSGTKFEKTDFDKNLEAGFVREKH
jgi:hypothetical protein